MTGKDQPTSDLIRYTAHGRLAVFTYEIDAALPFEIKMVAVKLKRPLPYGMRVQLPGDAGTAE